jgi:succinate dehydrogenase/fumarate reductase flavoprotein subunit
MGGVSIDQEARIMGNNGPIKNLYATGEVCGGVHGKNRLGGNSLLDCVVFGRVSGRTATKELL